MKKRETRSHTCSGREIVSGASYIRSSTYNRCALSASIRLLVRPAWEGNSHASRPHCSQRPLPQIIVDMKLSAEPLIWSCANCININTLYARFVSDLPPLVALAAQYCCLRSLLSQCITSYCEVQLPRPRSKYPSRVLIRRCRDDGRDAAADRQSAIVGTSCSCCCSTAPAPT